MIQKDNTEDITQPPPYFPFWYASCKPSPRKIMGMHFSMREVRVVGCRRGNHRHRTHENKEMQRTNPYSLIYSRNTFLQLIQSINNAIAAPSRMIKKNNFTIAFQWDFVYCSFTTTEFAIFLKIGLNRAILTDKSSVIFLELTEH